MRNNWILLILVFVLLSACKQKTVDFTYSPTQPKAGEKVVFTNASDFGEDWAWDFGDNTFNTLKSPSHVYRKPGEYTVTLMVDSSSRHILKKTIEVFDTIPSFTCSSDSILYFESVTFKASVWNPFKYQVTYAWTLPNESEMTGGKTDGESVEVMFTTFGDSVSVGLCVTVNGVKTDIQKRFYVNERPSQRLLTRTNATDYGQRLFGERFEQARQVKDSSAVATLDAVQDTIALYGDQVFTCSNLSVSGHATVEGFMLDKLARKIYFRDNGLYVANINGSNPVCLDERQTTALYIDQTGSRIYYATSDGVYRLPLLQTPDNRTEAQRELMNDLIGVRRLAVDASKR